MNPPPPSPDAILQTAFGFWDSKVPLTAVEFGLFTTLGDRRLTGAERAVNSGSTRAASPIFSTLVSMKFLDRAGDGPGALYFNTPTGLHFLDRRSPRYTGGILEMLNARLLKFWQICRKPCTPVCRRTRRRAAVAASSRNSTRSCRAHVAEHAH
jgi:hypothetical protein